MSLSHPAHSDAPDPEARLAALAAQGLTVPLSEVAGAVVVHTGFGQGPEFWRLAAGAWPPEPRIDPARALVHDACLVTDGARPVADRAALEAAGARLFTVIPNF